MRIAAYIVTSIAAYIVTSIAASIVNSIAVSGSAPGCSHPLARIA